jgi:SAM-dependent methyltransferase
MKRPSTSGFGGLRRTSRNYLRRAYLYVRRISSETFFERRWGTETARVESLDELGVDAPGRVRYEPSGWLDLRRVLRPSEVGPDDVFLDIGAGKGRVVLQAARYPFRRVLGVELSAVLCRIARANVAARRKHLRCQDITIINADATRYRIPDDVSVVYLYNPFRGPVFEAAIERLVESLDHTPRLMRVIYRTPLEEDLLLKSGRFQLTREVRGLRPGLSWSKKMSTRVYTAA